MPEHKRDLRIDNLMRRMSVRVDLNFAKLCDHFGIPPVTDEEVDEALAEEGVTRPVKSPTVATGQLSTGEPPVHSKPHAALPTRDGEPR
jgi:hypothetical protein